MSEKKSAPGADCTPEANPARKTGQEETRDERTAVQASLDVWAFLAKERLLMQALAGHIAELNLLLEQWRRGRK